MKIDFKSNKKQVLDALEQAVDRALYICGGKAESYAKQNLTDNGSVDTGLLRNSITFARGGKNANIDSYSANKGGASGSYSGNAPHEGIGERAVYIGTNVEYAPFVELGTIRSHPKPYLRPAAENHAEEYKKIIKNELSKANG